MPCDQRRTLAEAYQLTVDSYARSVEELRDRTSVPQEEYKMLWALADAALAECQLALRLLNAHVAEHGCQGGELSSG